ncbi:MAG: hypothetical protein WBP56_25040 [Polyangia bacterium]|jgi:DNA-directed RNA polymerase specialized sigma24 family protein
MDPIFAGDLPFAATSAKVDNLTDRARSARPLALKAEVMDLLSLFETHYASIWRLLRRLGVLPAQLDDAAQEVFWVAARRLCDIKPGPRPWRGRTGQSWGRNR